MAVEVTVTKKNAHLKRPQFIIKGSYYFQHTSNLTYRKRVTIGGKNKDRRNRAVRWPSAWRQSGENK